MATDRTKRELPRAATGGRQSASQTNRSKRDGSRKLKIIGRQPLETAIDLAVSRALHRHLGDLDRGRREAIRDTSRTEFLDLLRQNGRKVRGVSKSQFLSELEESRNEILAARNAASSELAELTKQLELYRSMQVADEEVRRAHAGEILATADAELGAKLSRMFELFQQGVLDADGLQREILALTSRMTRKSWDDAFGERSKEYLEQVDLLERRVAKLNSSLANSEEALLHLSQTKEFDGGVASIYRTVQGLSRKESHWKVKKDLLIKLFEANLALQSKIAGI